MLEDVIEDLDEDLTQSVVIGINVVDKDDNMDMFV